MQEIWKDIPGYEGLYQVSNFGKVRNSHKLILKYWKSWGYNYISLCKNNKSKKYRTHRLIAKAFIPNPKKYPYVNHIDGNKSNNNVTNLEWCTSQQNTIHAYKTGLMKTKKINQYDLNGNFIKTWNSIISASKELNINVKAIQSCCMQRTKTSGGYIWRYADN